MNSNQEQKDDRREVLAGLPVHSSPKAEAEPRFLRIDGLVDRPMDLTPADLQGLPQQELTEDFNCVEGWTAPAMKWRGVALEAVLNLAGAHPGAQWLQASAGEFSVPIPLRDADKVLLATQLAGAPLPVDHGGPVRLVLSGGDCWTSIKWLDRLEVRAEPAENTGRAIALGRLSKTG
jgi:DMSO/TMAO reductase YedYZ molybdopterin-dependent catalytic subunit